MRWMNSTSFELELYKMYIFSLKSQFGMKTSKNQNMNGTLIRAPSRAKFHFNSRLWVDSVKETIEKSF